MVIYDIEIQCAIPDSRNPTLPEIEYAEGWSDYYSIDIFMSNAT